MVQQVSSAYRLARAAILGSLLFVVQLMLSSIPNVELVTPLIYAYAIMYYYDVKLMVMAYIGLATLLWGPGVWVTSYVIVWSLLADITRHWAHKWQDNHVRRALFLGLFGLSFGTICAIPYLIMDRATFLSYIIQGLPYDVIHAVSNVVTGLFVAPAMIRAIKQAERKVQWKMEQRKFRVGAKKD